MATVLQHKVVAALPSPLEPDSIYYVRVGAGFDIYVTNSLGVITSYPLNAEVASGEWDAEVVPQVEAEAGTATTARKWTAQRVRQATVAWFNSISGALGRTILSRTTAAQVRSDIGLGTAATRDVGTSTGNLMEVGAGGLLAVAAVQEFDLNELTTPGTWQLPGGTPDTFQNAPPGAEPHRGAVVVYGDMAPYGAQVLFDRGQNRAYFRNYSGSFRPWVEILHTGNTGTAVTRDVGGAYYIGSDPSLVLKPRDYGLGYALRYDQIGAENNLNSFTQSMFFTTSTGMEGLPEGMTSNGSFGISLPYEDGTDHSAQVLISRSLNARAWIRARSANTWGEAEELYHTGNTIVDSNGILHSGTSIPAGKQSVTEGEWIDLEPYLSPGFYFRANREGNNARPRARIIGTTVYLSGVVSYNETAGPPPGGALFTNLPTAIRPLYTTGGVGFADSNTPLWFGLFTWIIGGENGYGGASPGELTIINQNPNATITDGAFTLDNAFYTLV